MTSKEIKTALQFCSGSLDCRYCPYYLKDTDDLACTQMLKLDGGDLINKLQARLIELGGECYVD